MAAYQERLYQLIDRHYGEEELRTLCFALGVEYESLGGRGKAAKARELVALMQRQQRLPELLAAVRQQRPTVNWPDQPSGPHLDLDTVQDQEQRLFAQVRLLLLPHVWSRDARQALLSEAFFPAHLWILEQIDVDGVPGDFMANCWRRLRQGAADGSLNERLLTTLKPRYGVAEQHQIDQIISAWRQLCAAQHIQEPSALATMPPRRPAGSAGTGYPTLFLSYADADVAVANQLRADLAAYGHACWPERPPDKGGDAWLAATAAGLGNAYVVLLLAGRQSSDDRWQRVELLAALDRHKEIIPVQIGNDARLPPFLPESARPLVYDEAGLEALLRRLPPPPPPARHNWAEQAEALRPRLAELAYMDRLKLAELKHVDQYTHLSGQAEIRRTRGGRLGLDPVVARAEFSHVPWRQNRELRIEQRRFEDAVAELKAIGRAVVLGDPGSGKTTTLYRLAADLIDAALLDPVAPVPLMIHLGLWTDAAESFPAFLRRSAMELGEEFEQRLTGNRVALLLDGLNEIPAGQQADKYRQVKAYLARLPAVMAILTCREQDYPTDRDLEMDRVTVAPLDPVRVQDFVHNYLSAQPEYGPAAADDLFWQLAGERAQQQYERFVGELGERLEAPFATFWLADTLPDGLKWGYENWSWRNWLEARAHPASLLLLATNPYMLFMLLDVYQAYGALPANRGQLFDQFVETLLVRERLFERDQASGRVTRRPAGEALLAGLTALAYEMQRQRTDAGALTALPLAATVPFLNEQQRYQAASANLITLGDTVRFAHQLLQEYFVACAMRQRIFPPNAAPDAMVGVPTAPPDAPDAVAGVTPAPPHPRTPAPLQAADIWPPDRWWQPTNWEEASILLAGLYSDDCTPVLEWVAEANPEVAARCIVESGAYTPDETKLRLRDHWLPRLDGRHRDADRRARAAVGRALGRVTLAGGTPLDNRPGVSFAVRDGIRIPDIAWGKEVLNKTYTIGGDKEAYNSFNKQQVQISRPYQLARYPVTYVQFQCFVEAPDFTDERWWAGMPAEEEAYGTVYQLRELSEQYFKFWNHPRESVSWYQAIAFCRWLSDKLGYEVDLPHEYEWEVAARYPDGRFYPWGNDFDAEKANTSEGGLGQTSAVGIYPNGANEALGLYDLSGNVWEWCRNKYNDPKDTAVDGSGATRVVRGGSWNSDRSLARAASRSHGLPFGRFDLIGFRLVVGRPPSQ